MRTYLRDAPGWQVAVFSGGLFGVVFAFGWKYFAGESWTAALVAAAFTGPAFGVSMALIRRRERRALERVNASLTPAQRRAARKAAWRGEAPADPVIRAAAAEYARHQLDVVGARWYRVLALVMFVLQLLNLVLHLIDPDGWQRLAIAVCGVLLFGWILLRPRQLRRRIEELSPRAEAAPEPPSS